MPKITYLYGAPTSSYLICTTPRSGSTFLSEALTSIGIAGRPEEYFQQVVRTGVPRGPSEYLWGVPREDLPPRLGPRDGDTRVDPLFDPRRFTHFAEYVSWVLATATTSNGVFGAKIMSAYVEGLDAGLRSSLGDGVPQGIHPLLASVFPRLRYVRLVRRDKVRQAVSLWRALQTWQWREDGPTVPAADERDARGEPLRYSFAALDHLRRGLDDEEAWWDAYFAAAGIDPLTIVYEDFADGHDDTVREVLRYLEIPFDDDRPLPSPTMRRQSDTRSHEWVERFHTDAGTG
ncbi:MAG: Stf0 family sulfotransferase [Thermoleophilia bacterium]